MEREIAAADPLIDLLEAAKPGTLISLIAGLAEDRPEVRRALPRPVSAVN